MATRYSNEMRTVMNLDANAHRRIVKDVLLEPDKITEGQQNAAQQLLDSMSHFPKQRCFNITLRSFSAMVPPSAKERDAIMILFGASAPLVARAVSGLADGDVITERYRLIGPAYVHGVMDDEAIGMLDKGLNKQVFELV
jgi:hypothetical protein